MKILVVDDEKNIRSTLGDILEDEGYEVILAETGEKALEIASGEWVDLAILDVKLPGLDGIEVFRRMKDVQPDLDVLVISGHSTIETAVEAVKLGAYDFVEKPLSMSKVLTAARNISEKRVLVTRIQEGESAERSKYRLVGESPQMEKVRALVRKVGPTNSRVLIRGETGAGKELVAFAVHDESERRGGPFVAFNSAAIPQELVESELFGHEKGAFTGAHRQKLGKLEVANGGTLFLDEIGDMDLSAQGKVLRVIEQGKFERVGGNKTIEIDVRILAATHKNLEEMIQGGSFREDLYYRLNVVPIEIPPLRERDGDIPVLARFFLDQYGAEFKVPRKELTEDALKYLSAYKFPGNVRELRNVIERVYILCESTRIDVTDLEPFVKSLSENKQDEPLYETRGFQEARKEFEIRYLTAQLEKTNWNISAAARHLGMRQPNLSRKLKDLGIKKQ